MSGSARPRWLGTGWKMNKTIAEARDYCRQLGAVQIPPDLQVFILPPFTALAAARAALPPDSPVLIGGQNGHWADEGAWTGEISMRMLADAGATMVELGHSERRDNFGETDATVALKMRAALDHGLTPLLCVGEPLEVRAAGGAIDFVRTQLDAAIEPLTDAELGQVVLAYEPVWAIGVTGRPAQPDEVDDVLIALADRVAQRRPAGCRALLYGGGVDRSNVEGLLRIEAVDGLFVGRAGWTLPGLAELIGLVAAANR